MNVLELLRKDLDQSQQIGWGQDVFFTEDVIALVNVAESVLTLLNDDKHFEGLPILWNHAIRKRIEQFRHEMKPLLEEVQ